MNASEGFRAAEKGWRVLLGDAGVLGDETAKSLYTTSLSADCRDVALVLCPTDASQLPSLVQIAARWGVPLYPVSTGHNWGYGCASPVQDGCVVLDLSRLNRILSCDAELGVVTLEPGVTQQQLRDYLDHHGLPFMVPTTGAGPRASLVGNALERGYGITPMADHFGAVTALEAVLADGSSYRSALSEMGGQGVGQLHKWGIGPYLDGIFSQSNFGIVTRMSIALARQPEHTEAFFFWLQAEQDLEPAVCAVRDILTSCGALLGGINLLNGYRTLSMTCDYPFAAVPAGSAIPSAMAAQMLRDHALPPWIVIGAAYGDRSVVKAALEQVRRHLKPLARRHVCFTRGKLQRVQSLARAFPRLSGKLGSQAATMLRAFRIMEGVPDEVALPLVYWKSPAGAPPDLSQGLVRRERGLIWYAPLIPMKSQLVRSYTAMVTRICLEHGMEPLITLTSLSNRCFDSSVPLLFDLADVSQTERAKACFQALFEAGRALGFLPYRMGIDGMHLLHGRDSRFFDLVQKLKAAMDPQQILAPGRYGRA
jgi:4-cresol dehydrogenase (hydroxylating)